MKKSKRKREGKRTDRQTERQGRETETKERQRKTKRRNQCTDRQINGSYIINAYTNLKQSYQVHKAQRH